MPHDLSRQVRKGGKILGGEIVYYIFASLRWLLPVLNEYCSTTMHKPLSRCFCNIILLLSSRKTFISSLIFVLLFFKCASTLQVMSTSAEPRGFEQKKAQSFLRRILSISSAKQPLSSFVTQRQEDTATAMCFSQRQMSFLIILDNGNITRMIF